MKNIILDIKRLKKKKIKKGLLFFILMNKIVLVVYLQSQMQSLPILICFILHKTSLFLFLQKDSTEI